MFSGFMLAHIPHWTMIDTMAWLPAILACLVRADSTLRPRWGALGGLALGVAFLAGHPQLFYHVVLATVALGLTLVARRAAAAEPWRRLATILLLVPAVALGVSAVQLIPSWEMAVASHRAGLGYDWKTTGSLLPAYLAQALLPWGLFTVGSWRTSSSEFYLYPGVLPLILAVHALMRRWDWRVGFHAVLGFVAILLAFGDHYGLYRTTYDLLPGLTLFRIPARFVGLAGFAVAILAGLGAQALVTGPRPRALARGVGRLALAAAAGVVPLMLVLVWAQARPNADDFQNFASQYLMLVLLLAGAALVVSWPGRASPLALRAAALVVLLADLLFGSYPVTDTARNPDIRPAAGARVGGGDQPHDRAPAAPAGRPHPSADDLSARLGRRRRREHLRAAGLPRSVHARPRAPAAPGPAQRPVRAAGRSRAAGRAREARGLPARVARRPAPTRASTRRRGAAGRDPLSSRPRARGAPGPDRRHRSA